MNRTPVRQSIQKSITHRSYTKIQCHATQGSHKDSQSSHTITTRITKQRTNYHHTNKDIIRKEQSP